MRRPAFLAVALAVALSSCGGGPTADGGGGVGRLAETLPAAAAHVRRAPPADAAAVRLLAREGPVVAIAHGTSVQVHVEPGTARPSLNLEATNPWGQSIRLLVLGRAVDGDGDLWLRIQLPIWPNGQEGWVAASEVRLAEVSDKVVVDLSARRLIRFREGDPIARIPVAVGAAATPTPPGRYFVWAKVETGRPSGPYGSFILGLSGFSETIDPGEWPGEPRLAIHGTADPGDAGQAVSKGCVRVLNGLLRDLRGVPMGAPVLIRP